MVTTYCRPIRLPLFIKGSKSNAIGVKKSTNPRFRTSVGTKDINRVWSLELVVIYVNQK